MESDDQVMESGGGTEKENEGRCSHTSGFLVSLPPPLHTPRQLQRESSSTYASQSQHTVKNTVCDRLLTQ